MRAARPALLLALLLGAALGLRSYRLLGMFPILVDEAIYLRWAEIIQHQHQWFISLLDAKQPLSYWIYAGLRMLWGGDPLAGGRLVSVAAGLLSTLGIYAVGKRLAGPAAGLIAAAMYAVLPYGVFYDRLAYTDALVNAFGVAVVYTSIRCFEPGPYSWSHTIAVGLAIGLGFFTKSTAAQFAFFPVLACLWLDRSKWRLLMVIYSIGLVFPLISLLAIPPAPTSPINDPFLHHLTFFTSPKALLSDPLINLRLNAVLLWGYLASYVTVPALAAAAASLVYLAVRRRAAAWVVFTVCAVPLALQALTLEYFPSRYVFPHVWPLLLATGIAVAEWRRFRAVLGTAVALPLLVQSSLLLLQPARYLYPDDTEQYLGSNPYAGFGVREAVRYLASEAGNGPLTVLTDPFWGPPADALFVYLNQRRGIRVQEAWWIELDGGYPILPPRRMDLMKSHYERVYGGSIDFPSLWRVYYVTDTNYFSTADVEKRQPGAKLVARFPKPNRRDSVDVYRLK